MEVGRYAVVDSLCALRQEVLYVLCVGHIWASLGIWQLSNALFLVNYLARINK